MTAKEAGQPSPNGAPTQAAADSPPVSSSEVAPGDKSLRLNFRGVPLDMVLNYLSEAAGFIIILESELKGKVDVWSNQPVSKEEALELLNTVLQKNGYAALRNDRFLTIVNRDDAKKRDIPVKSSSNPDDIPKNDEVVTRIIPVRYISAVPLVRDLEPLLPTQATMTANEGGNALVITDTERNIRRMAEIVRALDTAIASVSTVRVFRLQYADARSLATVIRDLFQNQQDSSRGMGQGAGRFFNFMRGGGPGGQQGSGQSATGGRAPVPRVVAVADERSNSVVVNAPEEQMPIIVDLVEKIDAPVEDITEVRVFRLKFADPQETADLLTDLFPDSTSQSSGSQGPIMFRGGPFGGRGMGGFGRGAASETSARMQKQTKVIAVPDLRTRSVVVSAARELMGQIASMIESLDADPARKQKVFVFSVENTDPQAIGELLQNLFPNQYYGNYGGSQNMRQNTRATGNQLNNRANTMQNQQLGTGGSGFGSGFGSGGMGGGSTGRRIGQ
jgi:general secretion pathway protein D